MTTPFDLLLRNVRLVSCAEDDCAVASAAFVGIAQGRIAHIGRMAELDAGVHAQAECDAQGALLTPGLIDCHTHLVYAGDRAREFEMRLQGQSYEAISRAGGGIRSTVRETRAATASELFVQSEKRLRRLMNHGVTTVEIKSGYGLSLDDELKCLRVARELGQRHPVTVRTTLLAAHALPPEFDGRADDYVAEIVERILPEAARSGLADAVDAFCDTIGFTPAQTRRVFEAARALGLPVKLHAEQLSNQHGAALAAEFGALSADHLEHVDEAGAAAMARAGTVAVMLPGAYYFLRDTQPPPIALFRQHRVPMAVATDSNPGTSPTTHLPLMMNMACTLFRMTPAEALLGVTRHAARALGLQATHGSIEVGRQADLCLWDADTPAELACTIGGSPLRRRFHDGIEQPL
ncbi:imidazolonepropionase [Piscinibacter sp.]|uniref:imidazolonepropionase n=1 Tax=Piscinibacter sp. TaxID=1903157 RepID=UPI002BFF552A|nr:imidazolonepropionase [Albitalea sp.]HUG22790.1 imidazolonepropionase [Albitalea sp.]